MPGGGGRGGGTSWRENGVVTPFSSFYSIQVERKAGTEREREKERERMGHRKQFLKTTKSCRRKHWLHMILSCHVTFAHGTDLSFDG